MGAGRQRGHARRRVKINVDEVIEVIEVGVAGDPLARWWPPRRPAAPGPATRRSWRMPRTTRRVCQRRPTWHSLKGAHGETECKITNLIMSPPAPL